MNIDGLERHAAVIPSMGGKKIGSFLQEIARDAPPETSIVEVGSWLGSGTSYLALGNLERNIPLPMHIYDMWEATADEVEKAEERNGLKLEIGQDTLPLTKEFLAPFDVPIRFHKCDINEAGWNRDPISVYVDDAAKNSFTFDHVLRTFGPHWIPGVTIVVLMDFNYWKKSGSRDHKAQKKFVDCYVNHFERLPGGPMNGTTGEAFRYLKRVDFSQIPQPTFPKVPRVASRALRGFFCGR